MSKKRPTETWRWFERSLRALYGDAWRKRGRGLFKLRAGEMRPTFDFDLDEKTRCGVENIIAGAMRRRAEDLRMQAALAAAAADEFEAECVDRRAEVWAEEVANERRSIDDVLNAWCSENVIDWPAQREAA